VSRRVLLCMACCAVVLCAAEQAIAEEHTPKPYLPDEFAGWMKDAWRADAVAVGSFPFTMFLTLEVYDTYRFVLNGFDTSYAPWPLGSGTAVSYSTDETLWLIVSAASLSLVLAGIDFLLGRINEQPAHD
jgi:hypothetical protein